MEERLAAVCEVFTFHMHTELWRVAMFWNFLENGYYFNQKMNGSNFHRKTELHALHYSQRPTTSIFVILKTLGKAKCFDLSGRL